MSQALKRRGLQSLRHCAVPLLALTAVLIFPPPASGGGLPGYAGSDVCRECHEEIYRQWSMTPHARMRRDTSTHPNAIEASQFSPEIPFTKKDIAYTIGSHWIQKYLTRIEGELYVLPKYWNITKRAWEPYSIFNWRNKPYSVNCYGCHTVGFDPETKTHFEDAIGCEACHGPGFAHTESEEPADIVNPAKLEKRLADMICESCHTDGNDKVTGEFPFAAGFQAGKDLTDYYTEFFLPKPGSKKWYRGDMTYEDRHRIFMYYQTEFYSKSRSCGV
jgi:hypothetical protein